MRYFKLALLGAGLTICIFVIVFSVLYYLSNRKSEDNPDPQTIAQAPATPAPTTQASRVPTVAPPASQEQATAASAPQEAIGAARSHKDIETFRKRLTDLGAAAIVMGIDLYPGTSGTALIQVENDWYSQPKGIRLQLAQALQALWAQIHSPEDPDKSRIKIVDPSGNEVGGSSFLGGTLVNVDD